MKRKRSLAMGALCGAACALCVGAYVVQVDERAAAAYAEALERYGGDQVEVCVAKRDIAPGETLGDSAVETKMWVAALLPEGAVADRSEAVGKTAGTSILKGEVIVAKRFDAQTSALEVPAGMTAVSVPAREVQAIGGALAAGMRADVYAIGASSAERILAQAPVLATSATDGAAATASAAITWVTLAVAPEKVQEVIAAAESLELYFVLPADAGTDSSAAQEEAIDPELLRASAIGREAADGAEGSGRADGSEGIGGAEEDEGEATSWIR